MDVLKCVLAVAASNILGGNLARAALPIAGRGIF
jgi:hypothetical protein